MMIKTKKSICLALEEMVKIRKNKSKKTLMKMMGKIDDFKSNETQINLCIQ